MYIKRSIVCVSLLAAGLLVDAVALRATTATSLGSFDGTEEPSVIYHPSSGTFTSDSFINITTPSSGDFKFYLRYSSSSWDGDRATTNNDRQRAEVRGLGTHQLTGETYDYQSTWRTDSGTRIGSLFYHITQVKAADGDNSAPLVTISLINGTTAQVDKCSGSEQGLTAVRQFSWAPATWTTTKIRLKTATNSTGMLKLSVNGDTLQGSSNVPMYRPSATSYWPKWGLYRGANTSQPYGNNYVEHSSLSSNKFVATEAKFNIPGTSVIASADDGNVPANTVDGSLATRWSASGDGQWIRYDIGSTKTVTSVKVAFYNGDVRTSSFDVQVSSDGTNFTTVGSYTSSGTSLNLETFNIPDSSARYVRLLGHGNSVNLWNSYTETEIWGF
jgi:hypothetical protein